MVFPEMHTLKARIHNEHRCANSLQVLVNQAVITFPINGGYIGYTVTIENLLHTGGTRKTRPRLYSRMMCRVREFCLKEHIAAESR